MLMVFTATLYDTYNWRYCQNEMLIWKWVFGKYLRNQKRSDQASFGKSGRLDVIHQEPPITQGGGATELLANKSSVFVQYLRHYQFPAFTVFPQILYYKTQIRYNPVLWRHRTKIRSK